MLELLALIIYENQSIKNHAKIQEPESAGQRVPSFDNLAEKGHWLTGSMLKFDNRNLGAFLPAKSGQKPGYPL
jgi:hypothetical protein